MQAGISLSAFARGMERMAHAMRSLQEKERLEAIRIAALDSGKGRGTLQENFLRSLRAQGFEVIKTSESRNGRRWRRV